MTPSELSASLTQFTGTENYYQWSVTFPKFILTDGAKFLAEEAGCYWLMDAIASHLVGHDDNFSVATLKRQGEAWLLTLDDGNGKVWARQEIEFSDFPLDSIKLYACDDGEHVVLMLTHEY